jgi:hypothetical protein
VSSPDERRSAWPGGRDLVLGITAKNTLPIANGVQGIGVASMFT